MMADNIKRDIVELAKSIWDSPAFGFIDSPRTRALREEILRNLLAFAMTDDERAAMLGLPRGCRVRESAKVISPARLQCGEYVWIGEQTVVDASGGLTIGAHTTIAVGALIWTHESVLANLMMDNSPGNSWIVRKSTRIGCGCYIGGPCTVYPGVSIGDRSVVLPMSAVTEDVPGGVMVGGSPARVIRAVDEEWIASYRRKNGLDGFPGDTQGAEGKAGRLD